MEAKNDAAKGTIDEVLDELSFSLENDDKKWTICISLCILSEDQRHSYISNLDLEEIAAGYLTSLFCDDIVGKYWHVQDSEKQCGILYGLLYLIGSNSKELIRNAAQGSLRRLLLSEIKRKRTESFFPMICVIKDVEEAKGEFKVMTERWLNQRDVRVKLDSFVQGLSLLVSLMEMELEQAAGNGTDNTDVVHTCRLIGYFILSNDHEPKQFLCFMMERLDPTFGQTEDDDHLWNWLKTVVYHISSNSGGEEVIQELTEENVMECFVKYTVNKKVIVCALLLRCILLHTPYGGQLNMMILAIERGCRDARFWAENARLVDRLRLMLSEQREGNNKKIKVILDTIHAVASNLDKFGLLPNVSSLIDELLKCLDEITDEDALVMVLRCLVIYMNRQFYPLDHIHYIDYWKKLRNVQFRQEELAKLLGELNGMVNTNIEETYY